MKNPTLLALAFASRTRLTERLESSLLDSVVLEFLDSRK